MKIVHRIGEHALRKDTVGDIGFFTTNGNGSYFSGRIDSRYSGFYCYLDTRMYSIIDSISLGMPCDAIINKVWSIETKHRDSRMNFFMPDGYNALCCNLKKEAEIKIIFDVRESYDMRKWGKSYKVYGEGDFLIIEFNKQTDKREDDTDGDHEYSLYIIITGDNVRYKIHDKWIPRSYNFDYARGSGPDEWFVYDGLKILSDNLIIAVSADKAKAIKEAGYISSNLRKLKGRAKKKANKGFKSFKKKEVSFAYHLAKSSLKDHCIGIDGNQPGIFAGFPWFFQFWTRDEAISLKSLMQIGELGFSNKVLLRQLESLGEKGRIPNRSPGTDIDTGDGTGWMFLRCADLKETVSGNPLKNSKYFSKFFEGYVKGQIEKSLKLLYQNYTSGDLNKFALNGPQETWMDTVWEGDNRVGIRIEIQALRLAMYRLAYQLSGKGVFKELEKSLKLKVKEHLWNGSYLADGLDDWTVRPNVFLAAYIYPDMLSKDEWKTCFDSILPKLWLGWGGVSSIDKENPLFCENYSGESPRSYHRGDSWFWINNLSALVMARIDRKRFKIYIEKILKASIDDILYKGFIGHHSELSSASEQRAEGSLCQAWSAAMFIELVHELNKK